MFPTLQLWHIVSLRWAWSMGKAPPLDLPLLMCVLCEVCIIISTCFHDHHISRRDYLLALGVDNAHLPAKVNLTFLMQAEDRFKQAWDLLTSALATNNGLLMAEGGGVGWEGGGMGWEGGDSVE